MSDTPTEDSDNTGGARMQLGPDTIHEKEDAIYLDCPSCGANVSIEQIITEGRCTGQLDGDIAETEDDTQLEGGCNAALSLELVWEA
ncbi:hypothetical protein BRD19_03405 [Halobacteriales archaeon SW_7_65_23]|nr:MAG: hypothetical protein BRD19_03405 [Halobacteriales archaeon SW_7_65_23]